MRTSVFLVLVAIVASWVARTNAQEPAEFYQQHIEPVLKKACFECHSHQAGEASGRLMLDSLAGMTGGGSRGPAIVPGKPDEGWLLKAIGYGVDDLQMPPTGKLTDEQIAHFRKWIADGAVGAPAGSGMSASGIKRLMPDQSQTHWAYRLPQEAVVPSRAELLDLARSQLPQLDASSIVDGFSNSRIDGLILAEQLRSGVTPSSVADRRTLARRVYYDLIGLPPTEAQLTAFVVDSRPTPGALTAWIDHLLASPHFGERFARYWMDIARYADTKGYVFQEDREYKQAYKYRDWLIAAFNESLAYDQFVRAQLAADRDDPKNEHGQLPALGFLTLGRRFLNNKNDIIDDRLDVVTRGLMGLTLACARCHDHKYDPISQADYYSLYGVFQNSEEPGGDPWPHRLADAEKRSPTHILIRGTPGNRGDEVQPRFVSFLSPDNSTFTDGSGRLELAAKIVNRDNPLTARVIVNRVWLRLLGTSLVDSPSDLGARCPPPKLQVVLDDLAVEFMNSGWDIKSLVRRLMTSSVYQQRSVARPDAVAIDAENSLYWRMNRRRVDFETLRDGLLAVTDQLDERISGPSEKIHEPPFSHRRTVYAYIDRQNLPGLFRNFDVASPDSHSPLRLQTTVPQQGLYLLNSTFIGQLAQQVEQRIPSGKPHDNAGRVRAMFSTILARQPTPPELEAALALVNQSAGKVELPSPRWQCGYGHFDPEHSQLLSFAELPFLGDDGWRGGSQLPDSKLGWCLLTKTGGHTGNDLQHAVVRRWIAPRDGMVSIKGKLNHKAETGDGVRATILNGTQGKVDQWQAKHQEQRTNVSGLAVKAGQSIDLVTDCIGDPHHDSFEWTVKIQYEPSGETYDSSKELPSLKLEPMNAWSQLAQALLASNEFAFID